MDRIDLPPLSPRLRAAADFVQNGARLIDVGTDHAYLPVYLTLAGRLSAALASDIAKGPIERARTHIAAYRLSHRIAVKCTPGLAGTEDFKPTDIVIAGMGGELIASILRDAEYIRNPEIRLILQPMTKAEELRVFLAENGFEISDETLVCEEDRFYQVILCRFTGKTCTPTLPERYFGAIILKKGGEDLTRYLTKKAAQFAAVLEGKRQGGIEDPETAELYGFALEYVKQTKGSRL